MINELEYRTEDSFGAVRVLAADKDTKQKNAWHLASISGNALPPISALGSASFGLPGKGYHGTNVESRELEVSLYADGADAGGLRNMLNEVPFLVSAYDDSLGLVRLTNDAGEVFRIKAKCTELTPDKILRRSALFTGVFDCPYPYFETDTLFRIPMVAVSGGKQYPLERPYTFGDVSTSGSKAFTVYCNNPGDAAAPCVIKLRGSGITMVSIFNYGSTSGTIQSRIQTTTLDSSTAQMDISTDPDNLYAVFGNDADASAYLNPLYPISDFQLLPGINRIFVGMTATSATPAETFIEWRGRYSACL